MARQYRRRVRRGRRTRKVAGTTRQLAVRALRVARRVGHVERQYYYPSSATITPGTSFTKVHMTEIAQGVGYNERKGLEISLRSFACRFTIKPAATSDFVRVMLFLDRQQVSDTTPTDSPIVGSPKHLGTYDPQLINRFKILYDKTFALSTTTSACRVIKIYKKLYTNTRYNGTASTDIQRNGLYLWFVGADNTHKASIEYFARVAYVDP